ncbi:MAG: heparan-alpha-glucosaminide N-acetyltransferase domain-containing protein [Fuerstiella sp.]
MSSADQLLEPQVKSTRLIAVDSLRGLVMILMALDHTRDFFFDLRISPLDLETTTPVLFFTRWVTHFCAPTFVFLAGASAYLSGSKHESKSKLSCYLLTRGAWLVFLEFTVVHFALSLNSWTVPFGFLVIAAIGFSMMGLSLLCWFPTWIVALIGIVVVTGHNLLDAVESESLGALGPLWNFLHDAPAYLPNWHVEIGYPILPWLGIMACGYGFGAVLQQEREARIHIVRWGGVALVMSFLAVRWTNGYGNPLPWDFQSLPSEDPSLAQKTDALKSLFSFLDCQKYPPSLAYSLMTLGPALIVLSFLDVAEAGRLTKVLRRFGQVPLFFYVVHFYVLHLSSCLVYWFVRGTFLSPFQAIYGQMNGTAVPDQYGFSNLWLTYCVWIVLLFGMWPLCGIYKRKKQSGTSSVWSYL